MKPKLSIIALSRETGAMTAFLHSLRGETQGVEVLLAGHPDGLDDEVAEPLGKQGVLLSFFPPDDEGEIYSHSDWVKAVNNAQADTLWHVDPHARLVSPAALRCNLDTLRREGADILHFKISSFCAPKPGFFTEGILNYVLRQELADAMFINKIYSRSLCRRAITELQGVNIMRGPVVALALQLLLAALARSYCGDSRNMTEYDVPEFSLKDHARQAAALYAALTALPGCFARWGHAEDVVRLASFRFRAELALTLGRGGRLVEEDANFSDADYLLALRTAFEDENALLNALVLGAATNAAKLKGVYQAVYGDTIFDPCPACGLQNVTDAGCDLAALGG